MEKTASHLFDRTRSYKKVEVRRKLGGISERCADDLLRSIPRIRLSKRLVLYPGDRLADLVERGLELGESKADATGAVGQAARNAS